MLFNLILSSLIAIASAIPAKTVPNGIIFPLKGRSTAPIAASRNITYSIGNPVLTKDVNVYYIYYGDFKDSTKSILEDFVNGVGDSAWMDVNKKYYYQKSYNSPKVYANGNVRLAGTVDVDYTKGKKLNGTALPELVQEAIDSGALPEDTSAVYFILTAGDVKESIRSDLGRASFCYDYCGYHVSWKLRSGNRIFYSQVGVPTACLSGCGGKNIRSSPNDDPEADAMTSVIAHELVEAISDPESDGRRAWNDAYGYGN